MSRSGQVATFRPKQPEFNPSKGQYTLSFGKRVQMGSSKNLQLVDDFDKSRIYLQLGKYKKDHYHLDFSFPFSIGQALAVTAAVFWKEEIK